MTASTGTASNRLVTNKGGERLSKRVYEAVLTDIVQGVVRSKATVCRLRRRWPNALRFRGRLFARHSRNCAMTV